MQWVLKNKRLKKGKTYSLSSHFSFLVFGHYWRQSYENTKILHNLCLHFARQDGQDGKKMERKSRNLSDQNTKNQKTKIWDEPMVQKFRKSHKRIKTWIWEFRSSNFLLSNNI